MMGRLSRDRYPSTPCCTSQSSAALGGADAGALLRLGVVGGRCDGYPFYRRSKVRVPPASSDGRRRPNTALDGTPRMPGRTGRPLDPVASVGVRDLALGRSLAVLPAIGC